MGLRPRFEHEDGPAPIFAKVATLGRRDHGRRRKKPSRALGGFEELIGLTRGSNSRDDHHRDSNIAGALRLPRMRKSKIPRK